MLKFCQSLGGLRVSGTAQRFSSTKSGAGLAGLQNQINKLAQDLAQENSSKGSKARQESVLYGDADHTRPDLARLRVVPRDRAFYMMNPPHEEVMRHLNGLIQEYINLPTVPRTNQPTSWMSLEDYRSKVGGNRLRPSQYKQFVKQANRLNRIDPQLMPAEVESLLTKLKSDTEQQASVSVAERLSLDSQGRAVAVGHRKTSSARVMMALAQEGTTGEMLVNGKPLNEYFPDQISRQKIIYPLTVVDSVGKYNIFATVHGGGITGQADAVAHGLGLALRTQNPLLGPRLRKAGCVKRDLRLKERKKPGLAKARKAYTWVKR